MSESDRSEEELWALGINDPLYRNEKKFCKKKMASNRRKACTEAKKKVVEIGFLKRRHMQQESWSSCSRLPWHWTATQQTFQINFRFFFLVT